MSLLIQQNKEAATCPEHAERRLLMVSNFLSSTGTSRGACEELAEHLAGVGMNVITTSNKSNKFVRIADMIATVWRYRRRYDVAQIDVYSGSAFVWAEAVCGVLRVLGKVRGYQDRFDLLHRRHLSSLGALMKVARGCHLPDEPFDKSRDGSVIKRIVDEEGVVVPGAWEGDELDGRASAVTKLLCHRKGDELVSGSVENELRHRDVADATQVVHARAHEERER